MEFAKPVIGTREPAPANLPILLKMFNPVKKAEIKINADNNRELAYAA